MLCASHARSQCNNVHTRTTLLQDDENSDNVEVVISTLFRSLLITGLSDTSLGYYPFTPEVV